VSPVPFKDINQAIETGKGKPDFPAARDTMADANTLAAAMVIAPLAGLAAAARKAYNYTRK
jgi:formate dehydrogenase iron-sulfur subunit